jgi:hypothetical protein
MLASPVTVTKVEELILVPLPNCPWSFAPQQETVELKFIQPKSEPSEILAAPSEPVSLVGNQLRFSFGKTNEAKSPQQ